METIGDCYGKCFCEKKWKETGTFIPNISIFVFVVAVTGLPEAQEDHAAIMAKFAVQCLMKVNPVLHTLVDKLGPETTELSMRFGLNSGPVTAGVLRGEKARFQL